MNQNFAPLFSSYSEMGVTFSTVSQGMISYSVTYTYYNTTFNGTSAVTESYNVVYASPTTYKVDLLDNVSGTTLNATAWVLKNGSVVAYDYLGQNLTGATATGILQGLMSPFVYEVDYSTVVLPFTSGSGVQVQSQGNTEIGRTSLAVTNYSAGQLPVTIQLCGGSFMLSSYEVQTGQVQGATTPLLTLLNVSGSVTYDAQTYSIGSLYLQLISLQKV